MTQYYLTSCKLFCSVDLWVLHSSQRGCVNMNNDLEDQIQKCIADNIFYFTQNATLILCNNNNNVRIYIAQN